MKMDITVRRDDEKSSHVNFRQNNRSLSDLKKQINNIKKLKNKYLTARDLIDAGIFDNYYEERLLRENGKGPEFSYKKNYRYSVYLKIRLLDWLKNKIYKKLNYLDENIEIIDTKISRIKSFKKNKLTTRESVCINLFNDVHEAEGLRNQKNLPKFIINKSGKRFFYRKEDLLDWLKDSKNKYLDEISEINEYLQQINKEPIKKEAQVTYTNALDDPLDQSKDISDFGLPQVIEFYNKLVDSHNISHACLEKFGETLKTHQGL